MDKTPAAANFIIFILTFLFNFWSEQTTQVFFNEQETFNPWLFSLQNEYWPPLVSPVDSDDQTCVTEQDRDKNNRPLILDVGETSAKNSRAAKPRAPQETSSHSEISL